MRYFPDDSFDDSLEEPLKELNFNESTGSYPSLSTAKRPFKNEFEPYPKRQDRRSQEGRSDNKENRGTDAGKLPVYHRGTHGEQLGTLIVRHHAQKDSKCIQCRNCGIFFTVATFLKHCHDQYGKRSECNGVHLQLGLDRPTIQQREAWGNFQKKMLSDGKEAKVRISGSSESRLLRNVRLPEQNMSRPKPSGNQTNHRIRRSSVDLSSIKRPTPDTPSSFKSDKMLLRGKEFLSTPGLRRSSYQNTLSLSQLNSRPIEAYNTQPDTDMPREKTNPFECTRNNDNTMHRMASWNKSDAINVSSLLATSLIRRDATDHSFRDANTNLWDAPTQEATNALVIGLPRDCRPATRPWDVPDMTGDDSFPNTKDARQLLVEDSIDPPVPKPASRRMHECNGIDRAQANEDTVVDTIPDDKYAEDLIKSAIGMLEKASLKMKKDNGNNSNAWRKMYEEERDHRMKLEAKVRNLERELRLKS